jgi:triosephosphate isomerase
MRTPLIAGNWKMHCVTAEAVALIDALKRSLTDIEGRDVLLAPPFPALPAAAERLSGTRFLLAAQNLHWEDQGAYTGEVSGRMLRAVGCTHVIIGHSERRQHFGETDESVSRKVKAALRNSLLPIVCVGETLEQREANQTLSVVERQVREGLGGLDAQLMARTILAYEPVWAIGTGKVATPEQAQEVHVMIRRLLSELGSGEIAAGMRILYGGSVKSDNIDSLMRQPDLDGALVGGASLKADEFTRIVRFQA